MNGGWLPPGCTDRDVDNAAPQTEPDYDSPEDIDYWFFQRDQEPGSEAQKLGEWMARTEERVREECGKGHRVSMMLMIERIIQDNKLDRFPKIKAPE